MNIIWASYEKSCSYLVQDEHHMAIIWTVLCSYFVHYDQHIKIIWCHNHWDSWKRATILESNIICGICILEGAYSNSPTPHPLTPHICVSRWICIQRSLSIQVCTQWMPRKCIGITHSRRRQSSRHQNMGHLVPAQSTEHLLGAPPLVQKPRLRKQLVQKLWLRKAAGAEAVVEEAAGTCSSSEDSSWVIMKHCQMYAWY